VDGAGVVRASAPRLRVAGTGRQAADTGPLRVGRARRPGPGAELGRVARAGRRTARGGRGLEAVRRAGVVRPVAALLDVAWTRRRTADAGLLLVGGARGTRAGAGLGRVTDARSRATLRARALEPVRRPRVMRPVAPFLDVAWACCRAADVGLLHVGGACSVRAGAGLAGIADAHGGTADHAGRLEGVRRTVVVRAVAAFVGVARSRRGPADVGLLDVGGAGGGGAGAGLDPVADAP